jgi:hypothetical protein
MAIALMEVQGREDISAYDVTIFDSIRAGEARGPVFRLCMGWGARFIRIVTDEPLPDNAKVRSN